MKLLNINLLICFLATTAFASGNSVEASWTDRLRDVSCQILGLGCPCPSCPHSPLCPSFKINIGRNSTPQGLQIDELRQSRGLVITSNSSFSPCLTASIITAIADCKSSIDLKMVPHNIDDSDHGSKRKEENIKILESEKDELVTRVIKLTNTTVAQETDIYLLERSIDNLSAQNSHNKRTNELLTEEKDELLTRIIKLINTTEVQKYDKNLLQMSVNHLFALNSRSERTSELLTEDKNRLFHEQGETKTIMEQLQTDHNNTINKMTIEKRELEISAQELQSSIKVFILVSICLLVALVMTIVALVIAVIKIFHLSGKNNQKDEDHANALDLCKLMGKSQHSAPKRSVPKKPLLDNDLKINSHADQEEPKEEPPKIIDKTDENTKSALEKPHHVREDDLQWPQTNLKPASEEFIPSTMKAPVVYWVQGEAHYYQPTETPIITAVINGGETFFEKQSPETDILTKSSLNANASAFVAPQIIDDNQVQATLVQTKRNKRRGAKKNRKAKKNAEKDALAVKTSVWTPHK